MISSKTLPLPIEHLQRIISRSPSDERYSRKEDRYSSSFELATLRANSTGAAFFSDTESHPCPAFAGIDRSTFLQAASTRLRPASKKLRAALDITKRMVDEHGSYKRLTLLPLKIVMEVYLAAISSAAFILACFDIVRAARINSTFSCPLPFELMPPRAKVKLQDWKFRGLGQALKTIDIPSLDSENAEQTADLLQGCRYIGSYSWQSDANKNHPVIVVPGFPNVWLDPNPPFSVEPDIGKHYRDRGSHVLPGQPLLPLVTAVHKQQIFSSDDWKSVDFLTDRNGLRKLLRWIQNASGKDFRIDTQLVGEKTVVLNRCEQFTKEHMRGNTYGFNFEKATTVPMFPATQRAESHHRIVTYKFGRFKMVVQFEVDGCLSQIQDGPSFDDDDELSNALARLGFSDQGAWVSGPPENIFGLRVHPEGTPNVPASSILEMTTSLSGQTHWNDRYPQLYFSQTENHYLGKHRGGQFYEIVKRTLDSPELRKMHDKLQPTFRQLEEALSQIQSLLVQHGKQERLSLVYTKPNLTVHRKLDGSNCLPPEAMALFD